MWYEICTNYGLRTYGRQLLVDIVYATNYTLYILYIHVEVDVPVEAGRFSVAFFKGKQSGQSLLVQFFQ